MPKFLRKPTVIDAEQFTHSANPPRGVYSESGMFHVFTIQTQKVFVNLGEWIVAESDGVHYYPIADVEFRRLYEPV